MTPPFPEFAELRALLDALCEESITPEQMARLEELVLAHPQAEAFYVQYMHLFANLTRHFASPESTGQPPWPDRLRAATTGAGTVPTTPGQPTSKKRRGSRPYRLLFWGTLGLAGLAASLLFVVLNPRESAPNLPTPPGQAPEAIDHTVALLLQAPGARWEETGLPTRTGSPLPPGWLRLRSGFAQIQFYCGATVFLEGPADFQLISRTEAYCARGKLRATVPPQAQGFTIGAPKVQLVDRGTEFGLQVSTDGKAEVHVFQGKVDLYEPGQKAAPRQGLTTGQGARVDAPGQFQRIALNPAAFLTVQNFADRSEAAIRRRQQEWRKASDALRQDPSLVVYYTFQAEQPSSRTLLNQVGNRQPPIDGAIVGCSWVAGRWPGRQALEFKRVSDRVRLHVPGKFQSLTLMAWVRVDALPHTNNCLFMADAWKPGGPHWQIGDTGKIILGIQSQPRGRAAHYHALEALPRERFGQWIHLAVVYDREGGQVTHYVDGQPAAQVPLQFDLPLRIGDAELGNWNTAGHLNNNPVRFFNGSMDEFLLFSRALGDEEIERLFAQGQPPL